MTKSRYFWQHNATLNLSKRAQNRDKYKWYQIQFKMWFLKENCSKIKSITLSLFAFMVRCVFLDLIAIEFNIQSDWEWPPKKCFIQLKNSIIDKDRYRNAQRFSTLTISKYFFMCHLLSKSSINILPLFFILHTHTYTHISDVVSNFYRSKVWFRFSFHLFKFSTTIAYNTRLSLVRWTACVCGLNSMRWNDIYLKTEQQQKYFVDRKNEKSKPKTFLYFMQWESK